MNTNILFINPIGPTKHKLFSQNSLEYWYVMYMYLEHGLLFQLILLKYQYSNSFRLPVPQSPETPKFLILENSPWWGTRVVLGRKALTMLVTDGMGRYSARIALVLQKKFLLNNILTL